MGDKNVGKRGQIYIFVVVGLVILGILLLIFFLKPNIPIIGGDADITNPQSYMEKCMKDSAIEAIELVSKQGGYIEPGVYIMYDDTKIGFTCYNRNFYQTCIMQTPNLISHVRKQIYDYSEDRVDSCLAKLKQKLEERGYETDLGEGNFSIELYPKKVEMVLDRDFTMTKSGETESFDGFKSIVIDPIYDLSFIAQEITNQESKFCNFDYLGFMLLYPEWTVDKENIDGEYRIYTIIEKSTGRKFRFGLRTCAFPAGM